VEKSRGIPHLADTAEVQRLRIELRDPTQPPKTGLNGAPSIYWLAVYEATFQGDGDGMRTVICSELGKNALHMAFDRGLG
jgi:hypothetical protein